MTKINIPNQKNEYRALNGRLVRYVVSVMNLYNSVANKVSQAILTTGYVGEEPFKFSDFPELNEQARKIQMDFATSFNAIVERGTSSEWKKSNQVQDLLADGVLKYYGVKGKEGKYRKYYQPNNDAYKAFIKRREKGLNLSQKIWNQSADMMNEMECCISSGIEKGISAISLAKKVSKYLTDYDKLKRDYKDKFGIKDMPKNMWYRSIRLARSEINMAYRYAENERWSKFDFVIGKEIKVSGGLDTGVLKSRHVPDICDDLQGKYPIDFVWAGWHPNCMCYQIPILKSKEEFFDDLPGEDEVKEMPTNFNDYVANKVNSIVVSSRNKTLPYFITDNKNNGSISSILTLSKSKKYNPLLYTDKVKAEALDVRFAKEADSVLRPQAGVLWRNAPVEQRMAVCGYTSMPKEYNVPLRLHDAKATKENDDILHLSEYIKKSKLDAIKLHRGILDDSMMFGVSFSQYLEKPEELKNMLVNKLFTDEGFMSCGAAKGHGMPFRPIQMEIYAPKGTKGAYIEPVSYLGQGFDDAWDGIQMQKTFSKELEVLLQKNTSVLVRDVKLKEGKWYVYCDAIQL